MNTLLWVLFPLLLNTQSDLPKSNKFQMPALPYEMNALEPVISKTTMDYHYGKHLQTYVDNLNRLIQGTEFENADLETIVKRSEGAIFNNAAQIWNHTFYFNSFKPKGGGTPQGDLAKAIDKKWGSFEAFKKDFSAQALAIFGSGWVWLVKNKEGNLEIMKEGNAGNPLPKGLTPILGFDVWEHAYYLDYQNRRGDHVDRLWDIINWDVVSKRF